MQVLLTGARTSTLLQRLPYLPAADAYVAENGGRIFYPDQTLPTAMPLMEDSKWRKVHNATGARGSSITDCVPEIAHAIPCTCLLLPRPCPQRQCLFTQASNWACRMAAFVCLGVAVASTRWDALQSRLANMVLVQHCDTPWDAQESQGCKCALRMHYCWEASVSELCCVFWGRPSAQQRCACA